MTTRFPQILSRVLVHSTVCMCTKGPDIIQKVLMEAIGVCAEMNERSSHLCLRTHTRG